MTNASLCYSRLRSDRPPPVADGAAGVESRTHVFPDIFSAQEYTAFPVEDLEREFA